MHHRAEVFGGAWHRPNLDWRDLAALALIVAVILALGSSARQMVAPFAVAQPPEMSGEVRGRHSDTQAIARDVISRSLRKDKPTKNKRSLLSAYLHCSSSIEEIPLNAYALDAAVQRERRRGLSARRKFSKRPQPK